MAGTRPKLFDSPLMPAMMKYTSAAHVAVFRATGGMVGSRFRVGSAFPRGVPVCLLTTRGRTTGRARTRALLYMPDGDRVVIVASRAGTPVHPHWYLNIQARPDVLVRTGRGGRRRMLARTADGDERADLWARLVAMYPEYGAYQTWTERTIPVVVCEPGGG
jgi:F420H(2)-dependent quinone reductase